MTPAEMLKHHGFFPLPGAFAPVAGDVAKAIKAQIGDDAKDAAGIGDAFNKISSVRDFFYDDTVKAAYQKVFPTTPTFLQACDIHNGFVQGNWHRDCANKNLKKGPDWDESRDAYTNYKLMIYLECDDYSFCVKPRTNRKKLNEAEGAGESYFTVSVEDAAKTDFEKIEQPVQFIPKPGDAVMFDLRTVHRGQGLNSEQFSKRASNKLTLSYVFADRNPHAHRFHSFRTMLKNGYRPFDAAMTRKLEEAGLWWDKLSANYFDTHKDELDFVVLK